MEMVADQQLAMTAPTGENPTTIYYVNEGEHFWATAEQADTLESGSFAHRYVPGPGGGGGGI